MEQVNRRTVSDVIIINDCNISVSLTIQAQRCNNQYRLTSHTWGQAKVVIGQAKVVIGQAKVVIGTWNHRQFMVEKQFQTNSFSMAVSLEME